jgi:hypothetical protein
MASPTIQLKRGLFVNLPALRAGEPGFTTDQYDLFLGTGAGTTASNKFYGSSRYWTRENGTNALEFKLVDKNGSNGVSLRAPATVATPVTYTLPEGGSPAGYFLKLGNSGVLEWASVTSGASFDGASLTNATFSGISTFSGLIDANAGLDVTGHAELDDFNVSGVGTIATADINGGNIDGTVIGASNAAAGTFTHLSYDSSSTAGISTVGSLYVGADKVLSDEGGNLTLSNIEAIDATTKATLEASLALDPNNFDSLYVTGISTLAGNVYLGDNSSDNIDVVGKFVSNLVPSADETYDIGIGTQRWRNGSFSGIVTASAGAVFDGVKIGVDGANIISTGSGNLTLNSAGGTTIIDDAVTIQNNLTVNGNVTIGGTTITLKGEDVYIENKDIVLGYTTSITPTDDTANHAGVAIASTEGTPLVSFTASGINTLPDTYKQMMWFKSGTLGFSTDAFGFNYGVAIGTTTMANGVRLAVGSGITMSDASISATNGYFNTISASNINATISSPDINITGITTTGTLVLSGTPGIGITGISSSTTLAENSNAYLPTQAAVKAYVDAVDVTTGIAGDTGSGTVSTSQTLTVAGTAGEIETSASGQTITVGLPNDVIVGTSLSAPTVKTATIQHRNGTQAATIDTSGNITASQNLTISGNLYVNGSTTQVNTASMTVEDRTIELGVVDGNAPSSTTTWDLGVLFNYYDGAAKKSALIWEQSAARFKLGSVVSDGGGTNNDSPQITFTTYAALELGELWINNTCTGGSSQVIACSGDTLVLQNITIDGGSFS